jgi:RND family efflux transporter MFP subunit
MSSAPPSLLFAFPIVVALLAAGCSADGASAPASASAAAELKLAVVTAAEWTPEITFDGTLDPVASVQLGFDVPGRIERLVVQRGATVREGEAVATLDDAMARAQAAQADAAVRGAEAQLAAGESGFKRAQSLKAAGGLSEQQYMDAEAAVLAGRAGVEQARAAAQLGRTHLNNHTLRAPISGTLTNGPDNAGMMVGAGTPLFLLEDLSSLQIKGSVSESDTWIREGMPVTVSSGSPGSDAKVEATVTRVIPALDPMTRRLPVEVRIQGAPRGFLAHGYARATIRASEPVLVFSVPRAAIVARPDFSVVVGRGEGRFERVSVEVVGEAGEDRLVRGHLGVGDNVVLYPPSGLGGEG